jgi:hypothetical protein
MGRTPLAMLILAARLHAADIQPHLFGYSVTFEGWDECMQRLENFITKRVQAEKYVMVGHSLGSILTRAILPRLVYAGTGGPRGRYSPFGEEANDGVVTVKETLLPNVPVQTIPAIHTFIMNSKVVSQDIIKNAKVLSAIKS